MSNLPQIENKFGFIQITLEELLELRETKVLSKNAYITMCLRFENPYEDKELYINIENFCSKWKVSKSDYYRCLRKLKEIGSSILNRLIHVVKFDRKKKPTERTISQTEVSKSVTEESKSKEVVTKSETKSVSKPLENQGNFSLRPKENNIIIEENKNTISEEEAVKQKKDEIPEKPYEHEPLIRFLTSQFCQKYGETSERGRKNSISHLRNPKNVKKRWEEYLSFIEDKARREARYQKILEQQKINNSIPVNKAGLEMINNFLKNLRT